MNTIKQTAALGQSIWLDFISRNLIETGELHRLVEADGIGGVTSNPAIFEKSVREGREYAGRLAELRAERPGATPFELYESLAVRDIQDACDVLRPVYERTSARDGYVSLEVTLHEGESPEHIVREARHLWRRVSRPNVMIKVPGTASGRKAFEQLTAEGLNVNVTLLFARAAHAETLEAWMRGLEARQRAGGDLSRVASVASFFVSRIDSAVDKLLEERLAAAAGSKDKKSLEKLLGKAAIANAKLAYHHWQEVTGGKRWRDLVRAGAQPQRVLWASTGTKNPRYSDVMYVDELIGAETVNTAPPATIAAFRDHGRPRASLSEGLADARRTLRDLEARGIALDEVTDALLVDGLKQFSDAFVKLLATIASARAPAPQPAPQPGPQPAQVPAPAQPAAQRATQPPVPPPVQPKPQAAQRSDAPPAAAGQPAPAAAQLALGPRKRAPTRLAHEFETLLQEWETSGKARQLWARDASLWTGGDEARWLDWLDAPEVARGLVGELTKFADQVRAEGVQHVLLLGMGGSSLAPEVLARTLGSRPGWPRLAVLDSTDPDQVRATERGLDLARTLVLVASKSGSTLEPEILLAHFRARLAATVGEERAARRLVAITDPGSKLERSARAEGWRRTFLGVAGIGGRFSALSVFGLVPAALIGADVAALVERAARMAAACGPDARPRDNPGVRLGLFLGACARGGSDKLTLVASPALAPLGAWLEQLVAESTGKRGKAIVPVDLEPLAPPARYGRDRVFAYLRHASRPDPEQDRAVLALEEAECAVVRIEIGDALDIGAEFFRWEIATAVAGAVLGIHPFDQPDVEASKLATRALTEAYERDGALPAERPFFEEQGIRLYADAERARGLYAATGPDASLSDVLRAHLQLVPGEYCALLAWLPMDAEAQAALQAMRCAVRDATRAATCVGFGPRFLHSTGQAYKGGPDTGVFLHVTRAMQDDLPVPGRRYGFGVVQAAQARGDIQVLVERGRRTLRAHLSGPIDAGLTTLARALESAMAARAQTRAGS